MPVLRVSINILTTNAHGMLTHHISSHLDVAFLFSVTSLIPSLEQGFRNRTLPTHDSKLQHGSPDLLGIACYMTIRKEATEYIIPNKVLSVNQTPAWQNVRPFINHECHCWPINPYYSNNNQSLCATQCCEECPCDR